MPINESAECINGPHKKLQPARGKNDVGVVAIFDGNFSNNYEGKINCRTATQIHYGPGEYNQYVNRPYQTPDDPDSAVDGVHEYGYRDFEGE
jgi:hypothetical protein